MLQSSTSIPKRNKKLKANGSSPYTILFVAFGFVCISMVSFFFHESDQRAVKFMLTDNINPNRTQIKFLGPDVATDHSSIEPSHSVGTKSSISNSNPISNSHDVANNVNGINLIADNADTTTATISSSRADEFASSWMKRMFESMSDQRMLTTNARSKVHQWDSVQVDLALHQQEPRKKVMFYMGWCAFYNMELLALRGGPGGEFVIWADLATGMAALGFELVFVSTVCEFWRQLKGENASSYDVIITDYDGIGTAENIGHFPLHHCKYYLVDGFGTQQPYNKRNFDLKRILTPYPFDNSNTPIHLVTGVLPRPLWAAQRENTGILWAKLVKYLLPATDPNHVLLRVLQNISNIAKLHTSLDAPNLNLLKSRFNLGDNILAAPHLRNRTEFLHLMTSSRFLLGVGMPVDGPTALEAIAHGCVFINPAFRPARQQHGKPTRFSYTSQHPFIEASFGPPHVYTIDIFDPVAVESTLRAILAAPPPPPLLHPSNTPQMYLENLRKIFYDTSCNASGASPKRHPGNRVHSSFTSYVDVECRHKMCPESVYEPPACAREMYNGNSTAQKNKARLHEAKNKQPKKRPGRSKASNNK